MSEREKFLAALKNLNSRWDEFAELELPISIAYIDEASTRVLALWDEREAALKQRNNDAKRLRQFAKQLLKDWPDEPGVDGFYLQDMAVKYGLLKLKKPAPTKPCGNGCWCTTYYSDDDWKEGVRCYRRTELLTARQVHEGEKR